MEARTVLPDAAVLPSEHASQRAWDSIQGLETDQCQDTSCTAPYKMYMNGGGKTVGDVTTTCLSLVASGCYQYKSPCCSALSAKWEQLEIATGVTGLGSGRCLVLATHIMRSTSNQDVGFWGSWGLSGWFSHMNTRLTCEFDV